MWMLDFSAHSILFHSTGSVVFVTLTGLSYKRQQIHLIFNTNVNKQRPKQPTQLPAPPFSFCCHYFSLQLCVGCAVFVRDILFVSVYDFSLFDFFSQRSSMKNMKKEEHNWLLCLCVCHEYKVFTVALSHLRNDLCAAPIDEMWAKRPWERDKRKKHEKKAQKYELNTLCTDRWTAYITSEYTCVHKNSLAAHISTE